MTEYTKGPWHISYDNTGNGSYGEWHIVGTKEHSIAQVPAYATGNLSEQDIVNARLIAAAPELLEALELSEATIDRLTCIDDAKRRSVQGTFDVIRAAIAKARKGE